MLPLSVAPVNPLPCEEVDGLLFGAGHEVSVALATDKSFGGGFEALSARALPGVLAVASHEGDRLFAVGHVGLLGFRGAAHCRPPYTYNTLWRRVFKKPFQSSSS